MRQKRLRVFNTQKSYRRLTYGVGILFFFAVSFINTQKTLAFAGGAGTVGDPFQITTAAELASMNSYLGGGHSGKYFKVMNDINLNVSPYNTGTGWTPIGNQSSQFYGKFDGNFKTISNLYINTSTGDYQGLFGYTNTASTISNVVLSNANVTGDVVVGSLIGQSYGSVTKAGVNGGSVTGIQRVGGLIGSSQGPVTYSYSNNSVFFNPTSVATCCAGGFAGEVAFGGASASINNSYSRSSLTITYNAYNQGSMGGFLGNDYSSGAKSNLYSTGAITMVSGSFPSNTGGLSGGQYTSITSSYWDTQTSGRATSLGGAGVVGKTTAEMKSQGTYTGWDFSTVWGMDSGINDGYPYLIWQPVNVSPSTPTSLGATAYVDGTWGSDTTPTLGFTLADTNSSDTVKYKIQIDDTADFSSVIVDYTSVLAAQGATSFTVGQVEGSGSYTTGSASTTLSTGTYYWRVKAIDNSSAESSYATANSGAVAFGVDATNPVAPGIPTTTNPTIDTTPTWTWTTSTDSHSGLAATPYTLQWSQSSGFGSGVSAATSATGSYTHTSALTDGTWYFRVLATDLTGNNSSFSSSGSVLVDSTVPTTPGTPSATSLTTDTTPTWTWTASTDSGSGLAANSYTVGWSKDGTFATNVSSTTSTTNSFTHSTALEDGTWYFRVKATDFLGNESVYTTAGTITINTVVASTVATRVVATASSELEESETETVVELLDDFPDYISGEGKQLTMAPEQVIHFTVEAETHKAIISEVGADYAVLELHSDPITALLKVGQTKQYDVNNDGVKDIEITLRGTLNGVADLVFAQVKTQAEIAASLVGDKKASRSWLLFYLLSVIALIIAGLSVRKLVQKK